MYRLIVDTKAEIPIFVYTFLNYIFDTVKYVKSEIYGDEFRRIRDETLAKYGGRVFCNSALIEFEFDSEELAVIFVLTYS
mgnify:CR=1 FL=1